MNNAFQIVQEDVANVINNPHYNNSHVLCDSMAELDQEEMEERVFNRLSHEDFQALEQAALDGNDINTQVDYAYDELARILMEKRILV